MLLYLLSREPIEKWRMRGEKLAPICKRFLRAALNARLRNTLGDWKKERRLPNFDDDNGLLPDVSGRFAHFDFRKGSDYISVVTTTDVIAKKFAMYVMDQLAADQKR